MTAERGKFADEPDDFWQAPFESTRYDGQTVESAMNDYLAWEVSLDEKIERDATTRFVRVV